jgi:hypothetical protein
LRTRYSVVLFRFAIIVIGILLAFSLAGQDYEGFLLRAIGFLVLWGLWILSGIYRKVDRIHDMLASLEEEMPEPVFFEESEANGRSGPGRVTSLIDHLHQPADIGDRVFKADETRTCSSCHQLDKARTECGLDGVSLARITLTAVGCQYWSPALHLAGVKDTRETEGKDSSEGDEEES